MSLKTILRNFLNHFETLENQRKCSNGQQDLYAQEFQSLKELTESLKHNSDYACNQGLMDVNRRKNRYKDILPYDDTRVVLSEYPGVPGSNYINANYVRGSTGSGAAYIASQGPLANTLIDFWRMIWECDVTVIVMACNETESGKYKCELYWPLEINTEQQYGNITVKFVNWRPICPDFLIRTFRVRCEVKSNYEERIVCQFHYTTWPDHGVPSSVGPILELVRLMRDTQFTEARPILIHCSAGCGRTGTICSIDYVWALLRTGKLREDFSLYKIIYEMRRQRIAMVQTQEQYILCYRAVAALFEQQLKMIDAHTYENLDEDGEPYHLKFIGEKNSSEEACSSDESEPQQQFFESRNRNRNHNSHSNKVKRSATFPSKDMRQLVEIWKDKKLNDDPSSGFQPAHPSDSSMVLCDTYGNSDIKQEKLIGRATVIRRPSVVRYKAMFGSMELSQASDSQSRSNLTMPNPEQERYYLHRSFAHFPTHQSDCGTESLINSDHETDADRESIYQMMRPLNQSHNSVNCLPKFGDHRPLNGNNAYFRPAMDVGDHSLIDSTESQPDQESSECDEVDFGGNLARPMAIGNISTRSHDNSAMNADNLTSQTPSYYGGDDVPPPKPPRTYQYRTKVDQMSRIMGGLPSGINNNNQSHGGRIIVSVAQRVRPRVRPPVEQKPLSLRSESKSQNDLYASSTCASIPSFAHNHFSNQFMKNGSISNKYPSSSMDHHQTTNSNSSQDGRPMNREELYECFRNASIAKANANRSAERSNYPYPPDIPPNIARPLPRLPFRDMPPVRTMESVDGNQYGNLRKEVTSPAVLMHNSNNNSSNNNNNNNHIHHRHSQPHPFAHRDPSFMSTIRSRPPLDSSSPSRPRPKLMNQEQRHSLIQQQASNPSVPLPPKKSAVRTNSNNHHSHHPNQPPIAVISRSNSAANQQMKKPIRAQPTQSDERREEPIYDLPKKKEPSKSSVSLKNSTKESSKPCKENGSQPMTEKKHYTFSFGGSFFPFRKSSKSKSSTTSPNPHAQPPHSNTGSTNIRPPHSHRFSPPTQWSQV